MVDTNEFLAKLLKSVEETNRKTIEEANEKQSRDIKEHIDKEIYEIKKTFEENLERKNSEWENKYLQLKNDYEKLEKELKKNNIVIFGLDSAAQDLGTFAINSLNHHLGLNLTLSDINNVYAFGKQSSKKPIIVKFISYLRKQEVLRNSKKLKGTGISVAEDLSLDERKENKILRQHLIKARKQKLNATIKNRKLIVNGQKYTAQQLAEEEEEDISSEENTVNNEVAQTSRSNSAPSTPNINRSQYQKEQEEQKENEEVFEEERIGDLKKKKIVKVTEVSQKLVRSSARLNSEKENKTVYSNVAKTPKR